MRHISVLLGAVVPKCDGVVVVEVLTASPADKAGIKKGDVIVNCGGSAASNVETVQKRVRRTKVGEQLHLELRRGAHAKVSAVVKLGEAEQVVRTAAKAKMAAAAAAEQQHRSSVPHGFFMMG
jgi:S1-C subfamily serine protease